MKELGADRADVVGEKARVIFEENEEQEETRRETERGVKAKKTDY